MNFDNEKKPEISSQYRLLAVPMRKELEKTYGKGRSCRRLRYAEFIFLNFVPHSSFMSIPI